MNFDFAKVCGKHSAVYEAYYKQIDPKSSGAIEAMTAAKFLKKSGLSDVVLSRVWDLSDPHGKGFLDKPGFFVALKLVSLAQAGQQINMTNIYVDTQNPPKVGDLPKILPSRIQAVPPAGGGSVIGDWSISVIDRRKYEQLFESLKPVGGMLAGNKVKGVLLESKLPMETLGKIWDLADQDKDGNLDKHEFLVAMHLVYQTLDKRTIPDLLPPELRKAGGIGPPPKPAPPITNPPVGGIVGVPRAPSGEGFSDGNFVANFPTDIAPPPAMPPPMSRIPPVGSSVVQPLISTDPLIPIGAPPSVTNNADWVVTPSELKRYEVMFRDSDRDKDGLVSGLEVKNVFLQSGVPQNCLAHIWALCDTNQSGKLTLEQFALAMWMVERKQKGMEPPQVLTSNMVPPSMRGIISGVDMQPQVEEKPTYSNPELEMISKEIEELAKERRTLETEIAQKEADIRIKSGEVRSLQSELDTLSATLKQLENQRGEAQKRLDDLKAQDTELESVLTNLNLTISQMRLQVNKIRDQCQKQEDTINEQEGELNAKRSELQKLKDEETELQKEYDENNRELQKLTQHLQNTQLQISSVRSMVTQLMEAQRQMTDALLMCRAAMENQDGELVSEYQLKIEPDFDDARKTLDKRIEDAKPDPFAASGAENSDTAAVRITTTTNGFGSNGFGSNGFDADPFASATNAGGMARVGFDDSFSAGSGFGGGFDAFGSSAAFGQPPHNDPFGGGNSGFSGANRTNAITPEPGKDDFGSDPFAALHAPTGQGQVLSPNAQKSGPPPRPESPSPALPPKKSKVPPPRPAPPRPNQGPAPRPAQSAVDAFGAPTSGSGFADFADFDNKATSTPPPLQQQLANSASFTLGDNSLLNATMASSFIAPPRSPPPASVGPVLPSSSIHTNTTSTSITQPTNLTRSIAPQQQATIAAFGDTPSAGKIAAASMMPVISGPTDFAEDPFKDYRYEDPFSIRDPFDDDDDDLPDPDKVFASDLSSDDERSTKAPTPKLNIQQPSTTFSTAPSTSPLNVDFLSQFDNFTMNPSPVPGASAAPSAVQSMSARNTPVLPAVASVGPSAQHFADFDAFSAKSSSTAGISESTYKNKNNSIALSNSNDSFFDACDDALNSNSSSRVLKSAATAFDAFGETPQSGANADQSNLFDAINDNTFEDDFAKAAAQVSATMAANGSKNFNLHSSTNNNITIETPPPSANTNFAKFDDFDDNADFGVNFNTALNNSINVLSGSSGSVATATQSGITKVQNKTTLHKTSNAAAAAAAAAATPKNDDDKLREKFAADYSNPDNFDADLQEALKRSMMEN